MFPLNGIYIAEYYIKWIDLHEFDPIFGFTDFIKNNETIMFARTKYFTMSYKYLIYDID